MAFAAIGTFLGASAATAALTGAVAVGTTASIGLGTANAISGSKKQKSAQRALDEQAKNSPIYKPDKGIDKYYQEAMSRYMENPFQSQQYQLGAMNARRATAQGLSAFNDRRAGIGGATKLAAVQNSAMQNLGGQAENQKNQRFNQFANATQMKSGDYQRQFDFNKMTPYNRRLQLEQMKAQAGGERYNAGMQMIGQGINNFGTYASAGGLKGSKGAGTDFNTKGLYQKDVNNFLDYSDLA